MGTWEIVGLAISLFLVWNGFLVGVIKYMLNGYHQHLERRFTDIEKASKEAKVKADEVEKQVLLLKIDLPQTYTQQSHCRQEREERVRSYAVIDSKLDNLNNKIDQVREDIYAKRTASN